MRYLHRRNDFLELKRVELDTTKTIELFKTSEMIRETFENDITWGGSLIGRLINSTLRVAKILVNSQRIKFLIPQVERCLNELLEAAVFSDDERKKVIALKIQMLLSEIIKVVKSKQKVSVKITQLVGTETGEGGLISTTIEEIKKIEDYEDKDELIRKLEAFKKALMEMREEEDIEIEESDEDLEEVEGEGEGEGEGDEEEPEGEDEEESQDKNKINETLILFLKSLGDLYNLFKVKISKKPVPKKKTWKGQEIIIISQKNQKKGPGGDETWNTDDDEFTKPPQGVPPGNIQIIVKNPKTNKFDKDSEIKIVKPEEIKESFIYEALDPNVEKQVVVAKEKISNAVKSSELAKNVTILKQLIDELESGDKYKEKLATQIMEQVFKNEKSEGKIISFQELIKEADNPKESLNVQQTIFAPLIKTISLISRVVISMKSNMDFLDKFGDSKNAVKSYIENYLKLRGMIGVEESTSDENEESKKSEETESKEESQTKSDEKEQKSQSEGGFKKMNYKILKDESDKVKNKFWELEEKWYKSQEQEGKNLKTGEGTRSRLLKKAKEIVNDNRNWVFNYYELITEDVQGELDQVYEEWRKQFSEDDEKKYAVDEKSARDLQAKSTEAEKKKVNLDMKNSKVYDRMVEIVDLFGRAYRMYATDFIPSGRPGGRISMRTMSEYEYIGDGQAPQWEDGKNPGRGPWAAVRTWRNWKDGIMKLLKRPEYRKILANSKFVNTGPMQEEGSGRTLFKFINDMISGIKGSYEKISHEFLEKYFGAEVGQKLENDAPPPAQGDTKPIAKDDKGEKGALSFMMMKDGFLESEFKQNGPMLKSFAVVEGKINGKNQKLYIYFDSVAKPKKSYLVFKFHMNATTDNRQSMITRYLGSEIEEKSLKIDDELKFTDGKEIYVGVYEFKGTNNRFFKKNVKTTIKFTKAKNIYKEEAQEMEIIPTKDTYILAYLDEDKDGKQKQKVITKEKKVEKIPAGDVVNLFEKFKMQNVMKNFGMSK